jgi:hypothetical protein
MGASTWGLFYKYRGGIMKTIIFLALLSCSAALAEPATVDSALTTDEANRTIWCEAHTNCRSGREISCRSSGASCTAHTSRHRNVVCVGYSLPNYQGSWRRAYDTCP